MRFLLDANMPRSAAVVIRDLGHEATDVRDIGLGASDDSHIAAHARSGGLTLVTRDFDFADVRNYPPEGFAGIVVLQLPEDATAARVADALKSFLAQAHLLHQLPGRLAIVGTWRVRFWPALR